MALTQQERDEINARMLELYGFSLDECEELSYKLRNVGVWHNSTPLTKLNHTAYAIHSKCKSKGADKGYKYTYTKVWSGRMTRNEYLNRLAEIDPQRCGIFLCRVEYDNLLNDRWWDAPDYRATHLRTYRSKITQIRKQYGLRSSDVAEFMRVA